LEVFDLGSKADTFAWYATGKVRNNTERNYGYVQVEINLYGKDGTLLGSTLANVNNLGAGKTWAFEALVTEDNVEHFEVAGVTGF
jgi:GMP synthase-like glutamine amidotransferase